jgi:hypothetical protein
MRILAVLQTKARQAHIRTVHGYTGTGTDRSLLRITVLLVSEKHAKNRIPITDLGNVSQDPRVD